MKPAPLDRAPTNSRLFVMAAAYAAGRLVSVLYNRGFADGQVVAPRDEADVRALAGAVETARGELGLYRELVLKHEDVLPPTPALWQLIGWCEAEAGITPGK